MVGIEEDEALRVRAFVDKWFWVLVAAFVVVGLVAGYVGVAAHLAPDTHIEERVESSWSTTGTFTHEAKVESSNPVFAKGSTLENRSVYYQSIAPTFNGTYAIAYGSDVKGDVRVDSHVVLQIRRVGEDGEPVYWETNRELASTTETGVTPGERVETAFRLNTSALSQRIEDIDSSLGGGPGSIQVQLVVWSTINGTVAGEEVQERDMHTVPLSIDSGTYRFGSDGTWNQQHQDTRKVEVPDEYGPLQTLLAPILILFSIIGLGGLWYLYSRNLHRIPEQERVRLTYRRQRREFDEWITRATLPDEVLPDRRATVTSLDDLVDLAIDTDERVIEDPSRDLYLVQHDDVVYTYSPPESIDKP